MSTNTVVSKNPDLARLEECYKTLKGLPTNKHATLFQKIFNTHEGRFEKYHSNVVEFYKLSEGVITHPTQDFGTLEKIQNVSRDIRTVLDQTAGYVLEDYSDVMQGHIEKIEEIIEEFDEDSDINDYQKAMNKIQSKIGDINYILSKKNLDAQQKSNFAGFNQKVVELFKKFDLKCSVSSLFSKLTDLNALTINLNTELSMPARTVQESLAACVSMYNDVEAETRALSSDLVSEEQQDKLTKMHAKFEANVEDVKARIPLLITRDLNEAKQALNNQISRAERFKSAISAFTSPEQYHGMAIRNEYQVLLIQIEKLIKKTATIPLNATSAGRKELNDLIAKLEGLQKEITAKFDESRGHMFKYKAKAWNVVSNLWNSLPTRTSLSGLSDKLRGIMSPAMDSLRAAGFR